MTMVPAFQWVIASASSMPFIRLDSSRDRKTGGTGLGLAISHRICRKHEGTLTADESPEGGAHFTITLPI